MSEHDGLDGPGPGGIVIAVLTYRRAEDLKLALPRLAAQAQSLDTIGGGHQLHATVLVIDNDPAASARTAVEDFARTLPPGLIAYVHEPKPGIAAARNKALTESSTRDLLVFIDDDEIPSERWLAQLLDLQRSSGAAAVVGPVISEYEHEPDAWISAGRFFQRRRLATGTPLTIAATNNLLLHLPQIRDLKLEFDERFGLSGGSDTLFTRQLVKRGGTMLWCDEAVVVDRVPAGRLTRDWVLRRALRSGNSAARVSLELEQKAGPRLAARGSSLASGVVRLAGGSAQLTAGLVTRSAAHQARGLRTVARGLGMASGAFGYVYKEYRRK
ncbi:glycosyltransferase [Arthrobacter sp. S39]|uniref:glycosyltransferase family 2 protein n=1 Tax=Arthrobacter sp. S39 TaxID=2509720 RepID=UPI0010374BB9|nr:glycosyltransferase [Arthrobacter sp. S39]TAP44400.1 glycosyltransferase [Arthrobacter sp. S39]